MGSLTTVGIIPARMAAARFPGKPLAPICGRPMVEHVYRRALRAVRLSRVYIATPDREIHDAAIGFGAPVIMTSPNHVRSTDRVAEAARNLTADVILNIQGDEPLIAPAALDQLCSAMCDAPALQCANLVNRFTSDEDFRNPNQIKVVCGLDDRVLFMSRQPIPTGLAGEVRPLRQLGVIAFRRECLTTFASLSPMPLERAEAIDMLRLLEHGFTIRAVMSTYESLGVDTVDDLRVVETRLATDPVMSEIFGKVAHG